MAVIEGNIQPVLTVDENGNPTADSANRSSFATGTKTVTVAGTPEQMPSQAIPTGYRVCVQAKVNNTGNVFIANSAANAMDATVRKILVPGQSITLQVTNLNLEWLDAAVSGEGVEWFVET